MLTKKHGGDRFAVALFWSRPSWLAMKPITPFDILKTPAPGNSALDSRAEQTENHALDNLVVELGQHTCLQRSDIS